MTLDEETRVDTKTKTPQRFDPLSDNHRLRGGVFCFLMLLVVGWWFDSLVF